MDGSEMRRGKPCWYRTENIGVAAINDCILMENAIYRLLRQHFRNEAFYMDVVEMFNEVSILIYIFLNIYVYLIIYII
jgi:farnesyl diphosphate synthase